jgi:hypothetical protein
MNKNKAKEFLKKYGMDYEGTATFSLKRCKKVYPEKRARFR